MCQPATSKCASQKKSQTRRRDLAAARREFGSKLRELLQSGPINASQLADQWCSQFGAKLQLPGGTKLKTALEQQQRDGSCHCTEDATGLWIFPAVCENNELPQYSARKPNRCGRSRGGARHSPSHGGGAVAPDMPDTAVSVRWEDKGMVELKHEKLIAQLPVMSALHLTDDKRINELLDQSKITHKQMALAQRWNLCHRLREVIGKQALPALLDWSVEIATRINEGENEDSLCVELNCSPYMLEDILYDGNFLMNQQAERESQELALTAQELESATRELAQEVARADAQTATDLKIVLETAELQYDATLKIQSTFRGWASRTPIAHKRTPSADQMDMNAPQMDVNAATVVEAADEYFRQIYMSQLSIDDLIVMLLKFAGSASSHEQKIHSCLIHTLLDEFQYFSQYPDRDLHISAALFGSIIQNNLMPAVELETALSYVLTALRSKDSKLLSFGFNALERFKCKLAEWPLYCTDLLQSDQIKQARPDIHRLIRQASGAPDYPSEDEGYSYSDMTEQPAEHTVHVASVPMVPNLMSQHTAHDHDRLQVDSCRRAQKRAGSKFESEISKFLRDAGIAVQMEEQTKAKQLEEYGKFMATPDFILLDDVWINGQKIEWIDAKSFYGSALVEQQDGKLGQQAFKYQQYFGAGAFVFKAGACRQLAAECGALVLDGRSFALKRTLEVGVESKRISKQVMKAHATRDANVDVHTVEETLRQALGMLPLPLPTSTRQSMFNGRCGGGTTTLTPQLLRSVA